MGMPRDGVRVIWGCRGFRDGGSGLILISAHFGAPMVRIVAFWGI